MKILTNTWHFCSIFLLRYGQIFVPKSPVRIRSPTHLVIHRDLKTAVDRLLEGGDTMVEERWLEDGQWLSSTWGDSCVVKAKIQRSTVNLFFFGYTNLKLRSNPRFNLGCCGADVFYQGGRLDERSFKRPWSGECRSRKNRVITRFGECVFLILNVFWWLNLKAMKISFQLTTTAKTSCCKFLLIEFYH